MEKASRIAKNGELYPALLREISNPPKEIFIKGRLPDASKICVAIVGTRKATREGAELARKTAEALAEKGMVIVSGLAMGVDTAAHEGALLGRGLTVAVLGNGIDTIYPAQNENLANKILFSGGAVISEYPAGAPSYPNQFLERNRIIAGLCVVTIVIEAPRESGALVTARLAAEYGREVFVFPGLAGHPQYRGSHALIRDGARLVDSVEDILEDLQNIQPPQLFAERIVPHGAHLRLTTAEGGALLEAVGGHGAQHHFSKKSGAGRAQEQRSERARLANKRRERNNSFSNPSYVLRILSKSKTPLSVDKIIELTNLEPHVVNRELSELMISGIIKEESLGYSIKKK